MALNISTVLFAYAQHGHDAELLNDGPLSFKSVLSQKLSDPQLKDYLMESSVMTVTPSGLDSIPHRHDAELFGYVLDGQLEVSVGVLGPKTYQAGEMFYEKRNATHYFTRNPDTNREARILLIFIVKTGREKKSAVADRKNK